MERVTCERARRFAAFCFRSVVVMVVMLVVDVDTGHAQVGGTRFGLQLNTLFTERNHPVSHALVNRTHGHTSGHTHSKCAHIGARTPKHKQTLHQNVVRESRPGTRKSVSRLIYRLFYNKACVCVLPCARLPAECPLCRADTTETPCFVCM